MFKGRVFPGLYFFFIQSEHRKICNRKNSVIGNFLGKLKVTEVIRDKKKKRTVPDAVDMGQSVQEWTK